MNLDIHLECPMIFVQIEAAENKRVEHIQEKIVKEKVVGKTQLWIIIRYKVSNNFSSKQLLRYIDKLARYLITITRILHLENG